MLFPIIRVLDKEFGTTHIVGTDAHDQLQIEDSGEITYYNLQNSGGTGEEGYYKFVGKESVEMGTTVEFVTFERLMEIYQQETKRKEAKSLNDLFTDWQKPE